MKFVQLAKSLAEGLSPVYLVEGEEAYFRDHALKSIREACAISQPALNDLRYEGETLKGDRLSSFAADLNTLPFLAERRLVRVYDFYPTEREAELLRPYLDNPCPSTVLVIVNGGKKAGSADLKRRKGIVYVDCSRESEETLARWLFGLMRRKGLSADGEALSLMVRYCGSDAARMSRETEKLSLLLGEGGRVTRKTVEEQIAKDTDYKIYELTQAASRKNGNAFCEILHDLMEKGFDEYSVLAALTGHYRTLYEISSMRGSDAEIAKTLSVKPYAVQKNREAAARLGKERVQELYEALYALSAGARSGGYSQSGALFTAIAKIFCG